MPIPLRFTIPDRGAYRFVGPLIFMAVGIGAMVWFHRNAPWLVGPQRYVPWVVGGFFVLSGVASIARVLRRDAARDAAQRSLAQHADAPWRVRPEWRRNELTSAPVPKRSFLGFALIWNLLSWPLAVFLIRGEQSSGSGDPAVWLVGLFPLIGLGMVAKVGFELARRRKFGDTVLALDPMPWRLGRAGRGRLRARVSREAMPEEGFLVKISCYRQRVRHVRDSDGDRRREVVRDLLWRDESRLRGEPTLDGTGVEVPFAFDLPDDAPPSTPLELDTRVLWEVSADAEVPGIDFSARFEVPVFTHEPGPADAAARQTDADGTTAAAPREAVEADPAWAFDEPLTDGILLIDEPDLFELHFTAARRRKDATIMGVVGAGLLIGGIPAFAASAVLGAAMLFFGAVLAYGTVQQATNDTVLRVQDGRVRVTHDGVGMPTDVDFPAGQVEEVLVHLGTTSASENARYQLSLVARAEEGLEHLRDQADRAMGMLSTFGVDADHPAMEAMREGGERPRVLVAADLTDKDEADWLALRIQRAVAREVAALADAESADPPTRDPSADSSGAG